MRKKLVCCGLLLAGAFCATGCATAAGEEGAGPTGAAAAQGEGREAQGPEGKAEDAKAGGTAAADGETLEGKAVGTGGGEARDRGAGTADREVAGTKAQEAWNPGETAKETDAGAASGFPGALSVDGTRLVDGEGHQVQLRGISTHGLAWYPEYVNEACFLELKEEWGVDIVRLAMYTAESGGYCTDGNREDLKALVKDGVEYATDCGLYAIIDWHILSDGNPNAHLEEAKEFFREMSQEYAAYENVFYEICNEPNGGTSWGEVKRYAEEVIPVIRENDAEGIILIGTPNWCQYVDQAAADPIAGYDNLMYTLHFYAATHRDSLRAAMVEALEAGLPIFVSEYGICDASGSGGIDVDQADKWVEAMDEHGISYVAWNLSHKDEASAILKSSCGKAAGFDSGDLSDSGRWLRDMLGRDRAGGGTGERAADAGNSGRKPLGADGGSLGQDSADGSSPDSGGADASNPGQDSTGAGSPDKGAAGAMEADGLAVTAKVVNSWAQGGGTCFQYELTLSNTADSSREGWTVRLAFSSPIALQDGWNGLYEVDGDVLTISSMDYNARVEKGGSVEGVGFIIQADASCMLAD